MFQLTTISRLINSKKTLFVVVAIMYAIAFLLRFWGIQDGVFPFTFDQGRDILDIEKIASGKLTLIGPFTAIGGVFVGPLYYYLLTIPFLISRGDVRVVVMFMGFLSMLSLIYGYYIAKYFGDKNTGIFFIALSAISSPLVAFSRYFHNPNPLGFLSILYVFFLLQIVLYGRSSMYILLFTLVGLMFHFEFAIAVFFTVATFIILSIFTKFTFLKNKYFYIGLVAFILTFSPQITFEFRHDFLMTHSIAQVIQGKNDDLYTTPKTYLQSFEEKEYIPWDDLTTAVGIDRRSFALFWLVILCLGFLRSKGKTRQIFLVLMVLISVFWLGSILYRGPIYGWYRSAFPQLYIFIVALGASIVWKSTSQKSKLVLCLVVALMYFLQLSHLREEWSDYKLTKQLGLYRNETRVLDYIYADAQYDPYASNFGIMVYTPPVYDYAWQYLLRWYGKNKYSYIPPHSIQPMTYLIIEPDPEAPWRANGWLETVVKGGNVLSRKEFEDKIVVEKRYYGPQ